MNIIVVGAGIAGLTAAISLRRAGHRVTIYERSSMNNEVGAAINVPPNATRFLLAWGLDPVRWGFVPGEKVTFQDPFTLEKGQEMLSKNAALEIGGAPLFYAHRVDLHSSLKDLATMTEGPGEPVKILLKQDVVAYNPTARSITIRGVGDVEADLVVGADGVHSLASEAVLGSENTPVAPELYNCCYRFLIPTSVLEADDETKEWNEDLGGWLRIMADNPKSRRIIMYPCRDNTMHNFIALFFDESMRGETREDWQVGIDVAEVLDRYDGFNEKIMKVIRKATEVKRWPLLYRHPLPSWHREGLVLVGDAAHPMLPHQAQGGAQGMEDGLSLGILLSGATTTEDIEKRLGIYERLRIPRTSVVQILSNAGQDQSDLIKDELVKYLPPGKVLSTPRHLYENNYGYNIVKESLDVMRLDDPDFALPKDFFKNEVAPVPAQIA